ncbi:MAG: hypothetical protein ABI140_06665 [Jatrophihabitantaceae bacterium]
MDGDELIELGGPAASPRRRPISWKVLISAVLALAALVAVGLALQRSNATAHQAPNTKVPATPKSAPDVLVAAESTRSLLRVAPRTAVMGGSNIKLTLRAFGPVADYTAAGIGERSAPAGQSLLGFRLAFDGGENDFVKLQSLKLGVSIAGRPPRQLPIAATSTDESGQLFVVAARSGTDPIDLVLTDAGITQRLSLRTGLPAATNIAFLRAPVRFHSASGSGTAVAQVSDGGDFTAHLSVQLSSAQFYYFVPRGLTHPSSPQDVFVHLDLCYRSADFTDSKTCHTFRNSDVIVTPTGHRPVRGQSITLDGYPVTMFEVPATFSTGTITIAGSETSGDGFSMTISQPLTIRLNLRPVFD